MKPRHIALAILVLVGVLPFISDVLGNIAANLLQDQLGNYAWVVLVPYSVIIGVLIGLDLRDWLQAPRQDRQLAFDRRNRQAMLEKVKAIWIVGVLEHSLAYEVPIALDLAERPEAVMRPLDLMVQRADSGDQPLPPGTPIIEIFETLDRALLILGVPGAGKTTLLLQLARDLLQQATQDPKQPMPVVFPLASWAQQQRPLANWLVDTLHELYDIPRKIGQAWVETDEILPLLDELDEVALEHRAACAEAINTFQQDHGLLPLVICSRMADYEALGTPLWLQGALVVQPLTHIQVNTYLIQVGAPLAAVRQALQDDSTLWELLDTPLMLAVVTLACEGEVGVTLHMQGTLAERRQYLFTIYIDRMFRRRRAITAYTRQQTEHWLTWLAWQMTQHGQTVFYLERMQPTWLPDRLRPRLQNFRRRTAVRVGLLVGLLAMLAAGRLVGLVIALAASAGVYVGTIRSLREANDELRRQAAAVGVRAGDGRSLKDIWEDLEYRAAIGEQDPRVMIQGVIRWLLTGEEIISVETLHWSWSALEPWQWRGILIIIPISGLITGLGIGLGTWFHFGLDAGITVGLFTWVAETLFFGLVLIPGGALASAEIETKTVPNEGIRRSIRNALFMGLMGGWSAG